MFSLAALWSGLTHQLRLMFVAVQLFSRVPIPDWVGFSSDWLPRAVRYFPAIGLMVAIVCSAVYWLVALWFAQSLAILLSIAAGIYLTGAFHEDGFADVCDGFGGGIHAARILEIMHDSRVGADGVVGVVMILLTKATSLALLPAEQVIPALLVAHPVSRSMAVALIWRMNYVGTQGKAQFLAQRIDTMEFGTGAVTALIPVAVCVAMSWLSPRALLLAILCGMAVTVFLARKFFHRIGGYTGDCLGAVQQISEVTIYLGLLAVSSSVSHP